MMNPWLALSLKAFQIGFCLAVSVRGLSYGFTPARRRPCFNVIETTYSPPQPEKYDQKR